MARQYGSYCVVSISVWASEFGSRPIVEAPKHGAVFGRDRNRNTIHGQVVGRFQSVWSCLWLTRVHSYPPTHVASYWKTAFCVRSRDGLEVDRGRRRPWEWFMARTVPDGCVPTTAPVVEPSPRSDTPHPVSLFGRDRSNRHRPHVPRPANMFYVELYSPPSHFLDLIYRISFRIWMS